MFKFLSIKNISSKTLSDNTGISTGNISDWKSGRSMPTAKKLVAIADYLDCSVDYLLGRTDNPKVNRSNTEKITKITDFPEGKSLILPLYITPASAGSGSWLSDDAPVEWITVPKNDKTAAADFILEVRGDSMQPKFCDGDCVLIKQSKSIYEGEIGAFVLNNESYIKKMGRNELISLNPAYEPIKITEYDDIRCAGIVIDTITL